MAFRAIGRMDREQLGRTIAGAQERARAAGETYTGATYSAGVVQKPEFPTEQMARLGIDGGEFGAPLNDKKHPRFTEARDRAKAFIEQAQNSPWFIDKFGGPGVMASEPAPEPSNKEAA